MRTHSTFTITRIEIIFVFKKPVSQGVHQKGRLDQRVAINLQQIPVTTLITHHRQHTSLSDQFQDILPELIEQVVVEVNAVASS